MKEIWKELFAEIPRWVKWTFLIIIAVGIVCLSFLCKSYPQDNAVEEMVEAVIKESTGEDVDLSPQSPEVLGK